MTEFKEGDIVKRKEYMWKGLNDSIINKDSILTVRSLRYEHTAYPSLEFIEVPGCWDQECFELVEEEKEQLEVPKFSRGDKVILTNPKTSSGHDLEEGWIGYVQNPHDGGDHLPVQVGTDESGLIVHHFDEDELELLSSSKQVSPSSPKPDVINSPKHYAVFESVEAIQVIASSMTQGQFYGYCFGNCLKYRLRAGAKDDVMQELAKANKYQELYTEHKHLCKEGK